MCTSFSQAEVKTWATSTNIPWEARLRVECLVCVDLDQLISKKTFLCTDLLK